MRTKHKLCGGMNVISGGGLVLAKANVDPMASHMLGTETAGEHQVPVIAMRAPFLNSHAGAILERSGLGDGDTLQCPGANFATAGVRLSAASRRRCAATSGGY